MSTREAASLRDEQYKDARNLNARIELHRRFSLNPQGWTQWLFEQFATEPREGARLLDVGCGPATLWHANLSRLPASWSLRLTDFSSGMLREARLAMGGRAQYAVADAQGLPFDPATFDVVVANHMLYHVPDRVRALREVVRVLAPGGLFVASTVGERHLFEIDEALCSLGVEVVPLSRSSEGFTLENGGAQLRQIFGEVRLLRYDDNLHVTEVEPLIAYVQSMRMGAGLSATELQRLRQRWATEIAAHGHVVVHKDSGVFLARLP